MSVTQFPPSIAASPVVEFRQYALKPGRRDDLIEVFEAHLIESQEATGMRIGGLFRDQDRPDRFVWMRGFPSMAARTTALTDFYTGPTWKRHAATANDTMLDIDDVFLLRPTEPARPPLQPTPRPSPEAVAGAAHRPIDECVIVTAWLHEPGSGTCRWLATEVQPVLESTFGTAVASWRTEPAANDFPALPVRDDHIFLWTATFTDPAEAEAALDRLEASPSWQRVEPEVQRGITATEVRRLQPTRRSEHPAMGVRQGRTP